MLKNWFFSASLALTLLFKPSLVVAGVCELVDTTFTKVTTGVAGIGVVAGVGLKMAGVTVLAHSSGTAIAATASGGYLAGTLGTVGAVTGVITAPVTLIISGVAVVAAGGTIAYCNFKDNNAGARGQGSRGPGLEIMRSTNVSQVDGLTRQRRGALLHSAVGGDDSA